MKEQETESYLTEEILTAIKATKKVTTSFLHRKFGIGYGKAAHILDELTEKGIIERPQEYKISTRQRSARKTKEPKLISDEALFEKITEYIKSASKASTSLFQRKFGIGYGRAARMIDLLEQREFIGPDDGSGKRKILIH